MKIASFVITVLILAIMVFSIKALDNIEFIYGIPFLLIVLGFVMRRNKKSKLIRNVGVGIFYSSLTVLVLLMIFFIWLIYNFPK